MMVCMLVLLLVQKPSIVMPFNGIIDPGPPLLWKEEIEVPRVQDLKEDSISHYEDGEYFEGDLAISQELIDAYYESHNADIQTATRSSAQGRWPNNTVSFIFDEGIPTILKLHVEYVWREWKKAVPCINFRKGRHPLGYVIISTQFNGCFSTSVGYNGPKIYRINLGRGCRSVKVILHEMGHILGTWHEQSRMDRDSYVHIVTENIREGHLEQFQRQTTSSAQGLEYDYGSVMHYPLNAFSKNGLPTIVILRHSIVKENLNLELKQLCQAVISWA